jgi:PAS domain S-box-containing protein
MDYRIKILAIDDHPDNLVSLKAIIGDIFPDAQFIKAENGITGIKSARLHDPDVILLDINMPDLDGFEVCRKIKSDHLLSDIPVVFVTAYATDKKIRIKALESGAEAFISKPLDEIELTAQITAMLKIKQANILKRNEKEQLADLVKVKTQKLIDELAERRLINEKLKQSEERYRTTLDNMLEGCQIIGSDWCYIYLNSTAELHNRRPKTEMLGHTYMEIWPSIEDTEVFKHIRNCMENRVFKQIENEFYYLDGSSGWFDLSIQPVPEGIFILSIDITDRKKAIKELQQSFDLRNNLTAMVPGVVYQYRLYPDGHSCFPYASPGMWDMYECTPEEVREDASLVFTRIHTDDFDSIVKSINESARNQTVYHSEFRVILPEQGLRWRLCNAKPQILEDGSTIWFGTVSDITESKIAEERLKENLTLLRIAGEYAKLGGWIVMLDDNRSYWSDEVALIHEMPLGYSPTVEDGIKFYAPEWRNKITKVFTDCSRKGIPYDEEMEIITATGKRVWIRTIGEAVKDENGKIYKVQGAFQDISERKQADEKLRLSEEKLKNVFEHSITGKSITEINGKISVNNAFCKMLGYSKSELSEIKWQQITHPDDIQQDQANINLMITGKEASMRWEKRYISKDKKIIWVDLGTILQRDQDGKPLYFITSVNDITERKNTEVALLKSESQLKEAQRIAHIGSWELDVVNNILSWSDEIYRIFEIDQKSFKASYEAFLNAIHPEDRDAVNLAFTNSLKNKSPYKIEHRLLFHDGRIKYVLEQCETMYNSENRPVISIGTVQEYYDPKKC